MLASNANRAVEHCYVGLHFVVYLVIRSIQQNLYASTFLANGQLRLCQSPLVPTQPRSAPTLSVTPRPHPAQVGSVYVSLPWSPLSPGQLRLCQSPLVPTQPRSAPTLGRCSLRRLLLTALGAGRLRLTPLRRGGPLYLIAVSGVDYRSPSAQEPTGAVCRPSPCGRHGSAAAAAAAAATRAGSNRRRHEPTRRHTAGSC